ncbi:restriction endonuclease [Amycolatopsis rifamycinica]|uniref:Restriction endonuclease type IV Mrr domain-containing protein n=1 Tax=Amycolatopsis rifamycinica TaxID=287986 RepID=A0A066U299_9PSEU|nr:restriction endonuclease [Amycolatopsis rifamycinica]KDN18224.1 hypothetical protein DV20_30740 [Amycolatopsis rifamycinica]
MARRKKAAATQGGAVAGIAVAGVVVLTIAKFVAAHPVASLAGCTAVLGAVICGTVLWRRRKAREARRAWEIEFARSQEIARYHAMAPDEFERALAFLCSRDGCSQATVTGRAGDLGADVTAYAPDGRKIVLQAKRYGGTSKVTGPDLQRFGGTCFTVHGAGVAAVVTTSTFTKQARQYAAHHGIRLLDGPGLAAWAGRTGPAPWH